MEQSISEIYKLSNGLRVVCRQRPGATVSYIGIAINAGSRDEDSDHEGLAHFVEHTIFKGTKKRKGWQIYNRMESIGGELNAYTSKEETMIYTTSPAGYEERAIELIADLVRSSSFPKEEIEREKEVVIEEILSYRDSPAENIYDEFEELAYKGSRLAHNILGTPDSVKRLDSRDCHLYLERFYIPSNMVVYCSSAIAPEKFFKLAEKYLSMMEPKERPATRIAPPPLEAFSQRKNKGGFQANTIIGARAFNRTDPRRFALFLLNNYLGGPGLNSILNRELREKRGYVYMVDSSVGLLSDTGMFIIYFGCDSSKTEKCKKIIAGRIERLANDALHESTLEKIKRQYCGQLLITADNIESRAMAMAKGLIYFDRVIDIAETTRAIMDVTPHEFMEAARMVSRENWGVLTID